MPRRVSQSEGCTGCLVILAFIYIGALIGFDNLFLFIFFISFVVLALSLSVRLVRLLNQWQENRREEAKLRALDLSDIDYMDGIEFELYIAKLLRHRGFSTRQTTASADLGVDIIAEKGGTRYAIQVKRQINPVSRRAVSDAVAGNIHYKCDIPMVITNNLFSKGAEELAKSTGCHLIDRDTLATWIIDFQRN